MGKSLSSKICSLILSGLFAVSAVSPNSFAHSNMTQNNAASKSFGTRLKEGCKDFYKKHPKLCKAGIVVASVAGAYGTYKLCRLAYREWCLRDVVTKIDGYSKEQINSELENEIKKYKDRAPDIFKVDDRLRTLDKRFLLLTFMKLNYLFDKYDLFTEQFIEYKRARDNDNKEFLIRPLSFKDDGVLSWVVSERTEADLNGFALRNWPLKEHLYVAKKSVKTGFWSERKDYELIDSIITHEFGHLIEVFFATSEFGLQIPKIRGLGLSEFAKFSNNPYVQSLARCYREIALQLTTDLSEGQILRMSSKELEDAIKKLPHISTYGNRDPEEFFAEVFAHLECSDPKNVNELGKNLDKFIVETMHYRTLNDKNI